MKNSILFLIFLHLAEIAFAQVKPYQIIYSGDKNLVYKTEIGEADSALFKLKLNGLVNKLLAKGHLLSNIDQLNFLTDTLKANIYVGEQYTWRALGTNNIPEEMLSKAGYRTRDFNGENFSERQFRSLISNILNQSANSGYPFASLQLQNIEIIEHAVKGTLNYDQGPVIYYDSLTVTPTTFIKPKFLSSYLRIRKDDLFQLRKVAEIENALDRLPYLKLKDSVQLSFQNNFCNIGLDLDPVKTNKVDALIGFLPNQTEGEGLLITGYINLHLQNLFRSGKELSFVWQQFQQQSQKLFFLYNHPNIFSSALGLSFRFDLLKQDTTFLNTNLNIEGYYQYKKMDVFFTTEFKSSRVLSNSVDTMQVPQIVDYNIQQLGARLAYNGVYNPLNPVAGQMAFIDFKVGNKVIKQNPKVVMEVYDSINLNPVQMELIIGGEVNQTIYRPFVLHLDATAGTIINKDQIFANDLMRLGGVNSLRGFNDFELFASSYALVRVEARVIIGAGSRLFLFFDQAWTKNKVTNLEDTPSGFGAGLKLDTGRGDLQLVYALGVSDQQSLSLTQSKIHIGYVARF